jgi:phage shock protein C
MSKKLYKSNSDKKIDGVCAGIAEYFNLDPTVVRIAWIIFSCLGGSGLLAYLICAIVMPRKPDYVEVD